MLLERFCLGLRLPKRMFLIQYAVDTASVINLGSLKKKNSNSIIGFITYSLGSDFGGHNKTLSNILNNCKVL